MQHTAFHGHHVEAAGGRAGPTQQVVPRRPHQAALLEWRHTGPRAPVAGLRAGAHFDKDQRALVGSHDEVDLPATPAGAASDPIIALHQRQTLGLQVTAGAVFGL